MVGAESIPDDGHACAPFALQPDVQTDVQPNVQTDVQAVDVIYAAGKNPLPFSRCRFVG